MYRHFFKRLLDIIFALVLLVLLLPVMLLVAMAIKLDSKGPAIFKQIRSGKNNKEFMLYKFRSMTCNNDFYDKSKEDQITKVGAFIRKTSLDELPQLFNIIKGEMSFIGPRPWVVDYAKYFTKEQMRRLEVLPGITGLAQCSGRNNLSIIDRINIDIQYINNMNIFLDLKIICKTIISIIKRDGFSNTKSAIHEELRTLQNQCLDMYKEEFMVSKTKHTKKDKNIKVNDEEKVLTGSGV